MAPFREPRSWKWAWRQGQPAAPEGPQRRATTVTRYHRVVPGSTPVRASRYAGTRPHLGLGRGVDQLQTGVAYQFGVFGVPSDGIKRRRLTGSCATTQPPGAPRLLFASNSTATGRGREAARTGRRPGPPVPAGSLLGQGDDLGLGLPLARPRHRVPRLLSTAGPVRPLQGHGRTPAPTSTQRHRPRRSSAVAKPRR